jgi:hypothetical protein
MARNGSGTFTTPNTFTPSTTISSSDVNENFADLATEMTNSLALDGQSTMTGQIKAASGTVGAPGWSFSADLDCGMYRIGANNIGVAVNGAKVLDIATTGVAITGTLSATGALSATGNFAVNTDKFTVVAASGNTQVAGTFGATGNATLSGTLSVSGTTTLQSAVQINSNVTVTGAVSGATVAGAMIATQAQMEAAASNAVLATPGSLHYHPRVPKAILFVTYSGGVPSLAATSVNIAGITDNGTGDLSWTYTTGFNTLGGATATPVSGSTVFATLSSHTTTGGTVKVFTDGGGAADPSAITVVVYGDL